MFVFCVCCGQGGVAGVYDNWTAAEKQARSLGDGYWVEAKRVLTGEADTAPGADAASEHPKRVLTGGADAVSGGGGGEHPKRRYGHGRKGGRRSSRSASPGFRRPAEQRRAAGAAKPEPSDSPPNAGLALSRGSSTCLPSPGAGKALSTESLASTAPSSDGPLPPPALKQKQRQQQKQRQSQQKKQQRQPLSLAPPGFEGNAHAAAATLAGSITDSISATVARAFARHPALPSADQPAFRSMSDEHSAPASSSSEALDDSFAFLPKAQSGASCWWDRGGAASTQSSGFDQCFVP
ncbi:hypothetical protein DIPPA_20598 [Diplonema papillatum]|nr:hypothetical protein DIPPA_20598 [Diplonema papillatum]|eukprot:gene15413-23566_t